MSPLSKGEEGWTQPYMESPVLSIKVKEENNNDTKLFKITRFSSSIKRNADNFVTPTIAKKIKTENITACEDDSNYSTENLLPLQTCAGEEAGGETLLTPQIIWTELNEINCIKYSSTNKILYYGFIGHPACYSL